MLENVHGTDIEMREQGNIIGEVVGLYRYPVKSMRGHPIDVISVGYTGFEGDRQYTFVQSESKSGFPWLTARNLPELILYTPRFIDENNVKKSSIMVRTPEGKELPLESPELREELETKSHRKVHLFRLGRGAYDAMPISILTTTSVDQLSLAIGRSMDFRRLRPNILVKTASHVTNFDNDTIGTLFVMGSRKDSAQILITLKDPRCKIPNIDPDTGEIDKTIINVLESQFNNLLGVYANVKQPGTICVGDKITMKRIGN